MSTAELSNNRIEAAINLLRGLTDDMEEGGLSPDDVVHLLRSVRSLERHCNALIAALTQVAERQSQSGVAPPAEDVLQTDHEVTPGQARAEAARARVLRRFPALRSALSAGTARTGNIDVLARLTSDMTDAEIEALAGDDAELADRAAELSSDSFARRVRRKRDTVRRDNGLDAARRAAKAATVRAGPNRDRTGYVLAANLASEDGAAFLDAFHRSIRSIRRTLGDQHDLSDSEVAVRALVEPYLRGVNTPEAFATSRPRVVLNVLTDRRTLESGPHENTVAETFDGHPLSPQAITRLACDATLRRLDTLPDGSVHASHSGRSATAAQRAALRSMYDGCAITGAPWSQVEVHHVIFSSNGGATQLNNLVPISRRWHHLVHEGGYSLQMAQDRTLTIYTPDGSLYRTIPCPLPVNQRDQALAA